MSSGVSVECWHYAGGWDTSPIVNKQDSGIGYGYGYGNGPSRTHKFTYTIQKANVKQHYIRCGIIDRSSLYCNFDANTHCATSSAGHSSGHHFDNADAPFTMMPKVKTSKFYEITPKYHQPMGITNDNPHSDYNRWTFAKGLGFKSNGAPKCPVRNNCQQGCTTITHIDGYGVHQSFCHEPAEKDLADSKCCKYSREGNEQPVITHEFYPQEAKHCCHKKCDGKECKKGCNLWIAHSSLNWDRQWRPKLENKCIKMCKMTKTIKTLKLNEGRTSRHFIEKREIVDENECINGCKHFHNCANLETK